MKTITPIPVPKMAPPPSPAAIRRAAEVIVLIEQEMAEANGEVA